MGKDGAARRLRLDRFAVYFAILLALSCVPLLLTALPPLLDYPNHLARMYLLPRLPSPDLQIFYVVHWAPLPNLGMDAVVPFLAYVMPLEWAGKAFIVLSFLLLAGGTAALHRALFGRWSSWTLLAFLLLYSRMLLWGFMGYLFACGLALALFAAWIALERRHWLLRVALGAVFALAIYLAHLLVFGMYAIMIAGYELTQVWRQRKPWGLALRDLAVGGLPFLPGLLLATQGTGTGPLAFGRPLRKLDLLFGVFDNYSRPFDVVCFVIVVLAIGFVFWRRWVRLAPGMALPLFGLLIAYLAMPNQLFSASAVDHRMPLMIFLVLIGSSTWRPGFARAESIFMMGAAVMWMVRFVVIAVTWHNAGRVYAQLMPGIDAMPRGACLALAYDKDSVAVQKVPLTHFPTLAVIRRQDFVPMLFHYRDQQPIEFTPDANSTAKALSAIELWYTYVDNSAPLSATLIAGLKACPYIGFVGPRAFTLKNDSGLSPVFIAPRFKVYHVDTLPAAAG